jgi:hypothetical protein
VLRWKIILSTRAAVVGVEVELTDERSSSSPWSRQAAREGHLDLHRIRRCSTQLDREHIAHRSHGFTKPARIRSLFAGAKDHVRRRTQRRRRRCARHLAPEGCARSGPLGGHPRRRVATRPGPAVGAVLWALIEPARSS